MVRKKKSGKQWDKCDVYACIHNVVAFERVSRPFHRTGVE